MTIDANLIIGIQIGLAIGILIGMLLIAIVWKWSDYWKNKK